MIHFSKKMSLGSADLPTSALPNSDKRRSVVVYESRALPLSYRDKNQRWKIFKKLCEAV